MAKLTFDGFYRLCWEDRWDSLKEAMLSDIEDKTTIEGLVSPYFMDRASIETAMLLSPEEGSDVLDMCAAPGGKSIVLASLLKGTGTLTSNDRSPDRRERMRRAFDSVLPETWRACIRITGHDASRWGLYEKEAYDFILLDAPCSSERHVLQSPEHLSQWSPSRPKRLQALQYSMFASAMLALRRDGILVYSTCSVNPGEDEEIVARFMKKHPGEAEEIGITLSDGERRKYGMIVLPDRSGGKGPMYAVKLRKI